MVCTDKTFIHAKANQGRYFTRGFEKKGNFRFKK